MDKYQIILDVCETKNISKTAKKLNYTRSAVSQCIKNFEQEIGLSIFNRSKTGMELLPNTESIIEQLRIICDAQNQIQQIASNLTSLDSGYIRIGTIQSISYHILPDILRLFSDTYPNITFDIIVQDFQPLTDSLNSGQLDCIFTSKFAIPSANFVPIMKDELMLATPRNHPLAEKLSISLADIDKEDFVLSADKLDFETGKIFEMNNIHPKIRYQLNEDFAALKMVEKGFGITILPKLLLHNAPFDVCVRSFTEHFSRVLGVAWSKDIPPSLALLKFLDYVKKLELSH
ncbi:LysR family transcriptional regulator [Bariatricus sp. SGI.154]|uniref:LysR family transcriptional regulator n=1 Tax=Bariatricus sp. SGI.154 TaxID=3420549 RepID=UPI003CFCAFCD